MNSFLKMGLLAELESQIIKKCFASLPFPNAETAAKIHHFIY